MKATKPTSISSRQAGAIVPRLAGYALLAFVLWLMVSTLVQPLVSKEATRAVLQAPVVLLTSPISGVVTQMTVHPLDTVEPGTVVATVRNPTVSREILATLTTQRLALQSQLSQLGNQFKADSVEMKSVGYQAQLHRQASLAQSWDAWEIAQRQREVALSVVAEQERKVQLNKDMLEQGAVSEQVVKAAEAQLSTARANAAVAQQAFNGQAQSVESAGQGAFVGAGGSNMFQTLASRRETLRNGIARAQQDGSAILKQLKEVTQLEDEERRRVEKLSAFEIKATQAGQVHTVLAPEGASVTGGASLVRITDCSRVEVVAVFPTRQARHLSMGSMLDVTVDDGATVVPARVEQLLPVASDAQQNGYSVPFPYAEQGSIYAVARIVGKEQAPPGEHGLCAPGKVVTASLRSVDTGLNATLDAALDTTGRAIDTALNTARGLVAHRRVAP
jgi:multidrug resistance efflux pump